MALRRVRRRGVAADDLYRLRFVADPQVSPDGSQVAYVVAWVDADDHTRYRSQLMLGLFDGATPPRPLTSGRHRDNAPPWSPDGTLLAFTSNRERDRDLSLLTDVWVVSSAGGPARRLTRHRGQASTPVFSPNAKRVAYLGHERGWTYGARTELLSVPVEGGD